MPVDVLPSRPSLSDEDVIRKEQITALSGILPKAMAANVVAMAALDLWFQAHPFGSVLTLLTAYFVALALVTMRWPARPRSPVRPAHAAVQQRRVALRAAAAAAPWVIVVTMMYPSVQPSDQVFVASLIAGLLAAGGFALAPMPGAARIYVSLIGGGTLLALMIDGAPINAPLAVCLLAFLVFIDTSITRHARVFASSITDRLALVRQRQVIETLLNDFEEQSTDWRFETGIDGEVRHVSRRLASALDSDPRDWIGRPLTDLLGGQTSGTEMLVRQLNDAKSVRNLVIMRAVNDVDRYWSVSAKPIIDVDGTVLGTSGSIHDMTETRSVQSRLIELARFDAVTGLPNRTLFQEDLTRACCDARRAGTQLAVLLIGLRHLQDVNAALGRDSTDDLLKTVAERLLALAGEGARMARLSAGEFAMVVVGPEPSTLGASLAGRIIGELGRPIERDGTAHTLSACIGIAMFPQDGDDPSRLLRNADHALIKARGQAEAGWRFFETGMDALASARRLLEADLRRAVANREFHVHYQPITDARTGVVTACEALVRWHAPGRGSVAPSDFIPLAEELGLIDEIGDLVLRVATQEAARWSSPVRVAVNLSARQFRNHRLIASVVGALADSGLPAHRLELEITETVLLDTDEGPARILNELRTLGVHIALDDFGTGYSSLSYLSRFPFNKIKIDRSFVQGIDLRTEDAAIVRTITQLATSLGMTTTAEGVETEEQLSRLRADGCTEIQGYLLGRPMPADAIARRLTAAPPVPFARSA